jgi:tRNA(fMet)-specific endonuclease VapC
MKVGELLADTNAVAHYLNGDWTVRRILDDCSELFVPVIVWGELLFGAKISTQIEVNLAKVDNFVHRSIILPCDEETASIYSDIRSQLKKIGRPIPDNDIWIAAIALQYNLPVITRDKHFDVVPNLQLVTW